MIQLIDLYPIFKKCLEQRSFPNESEKEFSHRTSNHMIQYLIDIGVARPKDRQDLIDFFSDLARSMLKKSIYGYYSLEEYRKKREFIERFLKLL